MVLCCSHSELLGAVKFEASTLQEGAAGYNDANLDGVLHNFSVQLPALFDEVLPRQA